MDDIDPTEPGRAMQDALSGGLFSRGADARAAGRTCAGWRRCSPSSRAGSTRSSRRRRASGCPARTRCARHRGGGAPPGGPAEQTFATLVGLELRPRRLREAAALWWAVTEKRGISGRDAVWSHPDLLPTAEDLDDPLGFAEKLDAQAATTDPLTALDIPSTDDEGDPADEPT